MNASSVKDMAEREIKGEASEEESDLLRSSGMVQDWLETLIDLHYDIHAQLLERKAAMQTFHNECQKMGPRGKDKYFSYREQYDNWRAVATRRKARIGVRIRQARSAIRELGLEEMGSVVPSEELTGAALAMREFLIDDENVSYPALGYRDRLLEEVDSALSAKDRKPGTAEGDRD